MERKYEIYDKEMLAVMRAFYKWSHYLKGAKQIIEVLTDHQNLTYFRKPQNLNWRQAHWVMDLQEYNFIIKHCSGKSNSKADILSRCADHKPESEDNEGVILLKEELFTWIWGLEDSHDKLYLAVGKVTWNKWDPQVQEAIKEKEEGWEYKNGYITWKNQVYIPKDEKVREDAIEVAHFGHPGVAKTLEQLTRGYWWPLMKKDLML